MFGSVSCSSFIEIRGSLHCSIEDALSALDSSFNSETTAIYEFDHIHPRSVEGAPTAVLYTELGREGFSSLHTTMVTLAKEGRIRYVLRHYQSVSVEQFLERLYSVKLFYKKLSTLNSVNVVF